MKILTISVAAYNVEKYLDQLMESVLSSSRADDVEILVIDDGSKDRTAEITKQYEEKYPDVVRLVSKPNGGHGSTINRGIIEAKGKYFRALDGDDWVDTDGFTKLIENLEYEDSDVVLTNYIDCYENGVRTIKKFDKLTDGNVYSIGEIYKSGSWMRYHTVIYKTSILQEQKITLDEHCFYVDSEFMLFPIPYVQTIKFYDIEVYCYRLGLSGQSVSMESRQKHSADSYKVSHTLLDDFYLSIKGSLDEGKAAYIKHGVASHLIWHFKTILTYKPSRDHKRELIEFDEYIKDKAPEIYDEMEQFGNSSFLVKLSRRCGHIFYRPASIYKRIKER